MFIIVCIYRAKMTQKRNFEYRSNDSTADLNSWILSFFEPGVLHGFYPEFSGLNLLLRHDQKQVHREVDSVGVLSNGTGVVLTRQGVVIKENEPITLAIDSNEFEGNPRIDLIVLDHSYTELEFGQTAVYMVIKGAPGVFPVAPALINDNTQIAIGSIYIPGGAISLVVGASYFDRKVSQPLAGSYELVLGVDYTIGDVTVSGLKIWMTDGKLRIRGEVTATTASLVLLTFKKPVTDSMFLSVSESGGVYTSEVLTIASNVLSTGTALVGRKIVFNNEIIL